MVIEALAEAELDEIRPMLLDLLQGEQPPGAGRGLTRAQLERWLPRTRDSFQGRNHVFAARQEGRLLGFCWCVLFDPGTGLEGEVAQLYVAPEARGRGLGGLLVQEAVGLFARNRVTFACVWTKESNRAAVSAYRRAGFESSDQLVLTWYPPP